MMKILRGVICSIVLIVFLIPSVSINTLTSSDSENKVSFSHENLENGVIVRNEFIKNTNTFLLGDDEIDQQQTETGGGGILCGRWMWAQSFVPTMPVLTRIELLIYKRGIVNDLTISIRKNLYGDDLASITKSSSDIPTSPEWMEFDFDDINVIPNETYFIVMSTTGGDNRENYYDIVGSKGDTYTYGDACIGWYSGDYWEIWGADDGSQFDFCFITYGIREEYHEKEPKEKWTYMLYDDADFENAYDPMNNFEVEVWSGKGFNAVVLQDTNDGGAKIWYIDKYHHRKLMKNMGEVNMGDYTTLRDFINYCKQNFPADKYIMDMYNHGGGWLGACIDDTDNDSLTMKEIYQALKEAGGLDILMFNAPCLMGNLEAVYELRDVVDVYIGSEEFSGYKLGIVSQICEILNHNYEGITSFELSENIIDIIKELGEKYSYRRTTMSAVRTDRMEELANSIDKLCKDLMIKWPTYFNKIKEAHKETMKFGGNYAQFYQLYDLYDFTINLISTGINPKIKQDIRKLQQVFNETIIANYHAPLKGKAYGLSIYFPDKLMNGLTIEYGSESYGLDFPKDTLWNEFLGLYVLSSTLFP